MFYISIRLNKEKDFMTEKQFERYQQFFEIASIGIIKDLKIEVYTDHSPIHFHVTKKDSYEVRIDFKTLKILSYKWQKNGKEISSLDIKKLEIWLSQKNLKNNKMTNREAILFAWKLLNE